MIARISDAQIGSWQTHRRYGSDENVQISGPSIKFTVDNADVAEAGWACDDDGLAVFERLRRKREGGRVFLCAFDLLEIDGKDLGGSRWRYENQRWTVCFARVTLACSSINISPILATSSSAMLAPWAWKASCRSGSARATLRPHQRLAQDQEPGSAGG